MKIEAEGGSTMILAQPAIGSDRRPEESESWVHFELGKLYYVPVALGPKEEDGLPVWCPILPGVATYGLNEAEALAHAREAILGVLEEYRALGQEVPWQPREEPSPGSEIRWIRLDVE